MDWQFDNSIPIYTQLISKIELGIVSGEYVRGQRLPAVRDLATEAGVNPNTMQRAFQELERLELVYTQRSSGRFVTEDEKVIESTKKRLAQDNIRTFMSAMHRIGYSREEIIKLLESSEEEENNNGGNV
ncbi:MAG: GntR family transcriptional regulator [Oscillospiraceae bacterium]|nr:GntR family transcriptional regulator [Oscillospiraceae bacterium]